MAQDGAEIVLGGEIQALVDGSGPFRAEAHLRR